MRTAALFLAFAACQDPFIAHYGGAGSQNGSDVVQLEDGGFVVAGGTTEEAGLASDGLMLRTDASGELSYIRSFGGDAFDGLLSIALAPDSGYVLAGYRDAPPNLGGEGWIVAIGEDASVRWSTVVSDGDPVTSTPLVDLAAAPDGGWIAVGLRYGTAPGSPAGDPVVFWSKATSEGVIDWTDDLGPSTGGARLVRAAPSGWLIAGAEDQALWVRKLDDSGALEWSATVAYPEPLLLDPPAQLGALASTSDGGLVVAGSASSILEQLGIFEGETFMTRLDAQGHVSWTNVYPWGITTWNTDIRSLEQTFDGGFVLAGSESRFRYCSYIYWCSDVRAVLAKFDASGGETWRQSFLSAGGAYAVLNRVRQTQDLGFVAVGSEDFPEPPQPDDRDVLLIKTDGNGIVLPPVP